MKKLIVLFTLVSFLAACSQPQPQVPTSKLTLANTLKTLRSPTESPIITLTPTFTFTQIPRQTNTYIYPTMDPTEAALYTQAEVFPKDCEGFHGNPFLISRDGKWLAEDCYILPYPELRVFDLTGTKIYKVTYEDIFDHQELSVYANVIFPIHWALDNQYLYFSSDSQGSDGIQISPLDYRYNGALYKMSITTGKWSKVVGILDEGDTSYSFSPTDRRVIYPTHQHFLEWILNILDLQTGSIETINFNGSYEIGHYVWSPDGLSFGLTVITLLTPYDFDHPNYQVFIYDISKKSLQEIIPATSERRIIANWSSENILEIPLIHPTHPRETIPDHTLYYDVKTDSFIQATPTP